MLGHLSHIMLYTTKIERAVEWYVDTLGFRLGYHAEGEYASLTHPTAGRIALHQTNKAEDVGRGPVPYFVVSDIDATVSWLRAKGVKCCDPRTEGNSPRFTDFCDLDGNVLGLEEDK